MTIRDRMAGWLGGGEPVETVPAASPPESVASVDSGALDELRRRAAAPDSLRAGIVARLGIAADAAPDAVLAAMDTALAERPYAGPPEGSELIDSPTLADLRRDAEQGRGARHRALLADAIRTGRVPPASRGSWAVLLANDPNGEATLASLKPNTIPVRSQGYSDDPEGERSPYSELFGDQ